MALSACAESAVVIFTFYWAPWIASACSSMQTSGGLEDGGPALPLSETLDTSVDPSGGGLALGDASAAGGVARALLGEAPDDMHFLHGAELPYILIYSTLMMSAMLGRWRCV